MKLADLGLKTKPATKYVEGGYISFKTTNHDLSFRVVRVTKSNQSSLDGDWVRDKKHLESLLNCKTIKEVIQL